jgi:hypothetical protein
VKVVYNSAWGRGSVNHESSGESLNLFLGVIGVSNARPISVLPRTWRANINNALRMVDGRETLEHMKAIAVTISPFAKLGIGSCGRGENDARHEI